MKSLSLKAWPILLEHLVCGGRLSGDFACHCCPCSGVCGGGSIACISAHSSSADARLAGEDVQKLVAMYMLALLGQIQVAVLLIKLRALPLPNYCQGLSASSYVKSASTSSSLTSQHDNVLALVPGSSAKTASLPHETDQWGTVSFNIRLRGFQHYLCRLCGHEAVQSRLNRENDRAPESEQRVPTPTDASLGSDASAFSLPAAIARLWLLSSCS